MKQAEKETFLDININQILSNKKSAVSEKFSKNVLAYGRSPAKSFYCEAKRVGVMCNKAFVDRKNYNRLRYEEPKKPHSNLQRGTLKLRIGRLLKPPLPFL